MSKEILPMQPMALGGDRRSAMITTPLRGRAVDFEYVVSLMQSTGIHSGWMPLNGQSDIYVARNTLANAFLLQSKLENQIWIDGDIGWSRADLLSLIDSPHPVVSGLYCGHGVPQWICRDQEGNEIPPDKMPETGFKKAKLIGMGFLKVHRSVYETIIAKGLAPKYGVCHQFFNGSIEDDFLLSEDYSFSSLCRKAGIQPMLNCDVRVLHGGKSLGKINPNSGSGR
jgi:hypothetical protein